MMIVVFLLFLVLLPDVYIWFSFVRGSSLIVSVLHWLPTFVVLVSMLIFGTNRSPTALQVTFFLVVCLTFPKLLFAVVSLLGKGIAIFVPKAFCVGNVVALVVLLIAFVLAVYGSTMGWKRLQVNEQTLHFATLPESFDGYKIVQISDLHLGTNGKSTAFVEKIVDTINSLSPDLVVFTGDLVNTDVSEIQPFKCVLTKIKARDGVFSILGNHDYFIYGDPKTREQSLDTLISVERGLGWNLLLNETRIIKRGDDSIALVGVEYIGKFTNPRGDLGKAMQNVEPESFTILLSHDPWHWRHEVLPKTNIELTLSGHTHAAQLKIGRFSPSQWVFEDWGGMYNSENQVLNVSVGAGGTAPFRLGAWPEINVISLHR